MAEQSDSWDRTLEVGAKTTARLEAMLATAKSRASVQRAVTDANAFLSLLGRKAGE